MIAPLHELQDLILSANPCAPMATTGGDRFLARVRAALASRASGSAMVGPSDLAALLRQGLLRSQTAPGEIPELLVPQAPGWPDEETWRVFGCDVHQSRPGHLLVRARRWEPAWLDPHAPSVVDAAIREDPRRRFRFVAADPIVTDCVGHLNYVSPGQRAAVQAAFLMPPGSTVIVNLPTGGGKTLAFQVPALAFGPQSGLTLVVVPTVALAKDQEDRFRALGAERQEGRAWSALPLAYHGGLDEESKSAIRVAIRDGGIPIVFASAEAIVGSLRGPLFEAARQGRLRVFAIDEAHIVSQWGQQFRPEFQSMAGLRDALLAACPPGAAFRTLLLTATLTPESYETLRYLFGHDRCQMVSEVRLRQEPGFLIYSARDELDRKERVMDAIRHLPRPLILYTTLREHAESWYEWLSAAGFRRHRLVRGGDLAAADGDRVLREWRGQALDIIVATSAFGLGVDQGEVRSVVHACLPETVDRYYQEVGRAGRDGCAAAALLVSTPRDAVIAKGMAEEKLISVDRAFERWEAMWLRRRQSGDKDYVLSLDDRPPDIAGTGQRNASWNLRTLVLMARAGLVTFAAHPPPAIDLGPGEDDLSFEERRQKALERFSREVAIRIRDPRHSEAAYWNGVVARTRGALRAADEQAARLVGELRNLQRPLNEVFCEVYSISDPFVRPAALAGSCPVTRRNGTVSFDSTDPEVTAITEGAAGLSADFDRSLAPSYDDAKRSWVAYEPVANDRREQRRWRERVLTLLRYAVAGGIVELSVPDGLLSKEEWSQLAVRAPLRFLVRATISASETVASALPVPRLTLLGEREVTPEGIKRVMRVDRPCHVILLPRDVPDPTRPYRQLFDVVRHLSLDDLLSRLAS